MHGGEAVALPREEAEHLTRVLRLREGDAVRVFDGGGREFDAVVERLARSAVWVRAGAERQPPREPAVRVTLVQAVLKGDRMDAVVRDAVMMGVGAVVPLVSTRSEVSLASLDRARRQERWQRVAVASAKQCGRATVPAVARPVDWTGWPAPGGLPLPEPRIILVEPAAGGFPPRLEPPAGGAPAPEAPASPWPLSAAGVPGTDVQGTDVPDAATIVVGPEGGWTEEELARMRGEARFVCLGHLTLRAESAALVALAALFTRWGVY